MSPTNPKTPLSPLSRRRALALLGGAATTCLVGHASAAPPAAAGARATLPTLALVGAEVHVGDGAVIKDGIVIVRGERITAVGGPGARGQIPPGASVVELKGKLLTPGLCAADSLLGIVEIDMESSTRDDGGGEGPIRAAYDAASAINASSSLIQVQAIEGVTSAAVAPSGGLLSGQVAWIDLLHGDRDRLVQRPRIAVDGSLGQVAGSRAATLARLREVLADARLYRGQRSAHQRRQLRDLAAHPRDLEALFPVLDRKIPLTLTAHRQSDIAAALDLAAEERLRVVIVGGAEAWTLAERLAAAKVPVIVEPSANLPGSFDSLGARLDNAALLSAAGVEVAIAHLGEPHNLRNITQEAGLAVANGMPWERALTGVSLAVARAYGVDADYGSVAAGKVANLVVWGGDPFELANFPEQVYVRGEAIPMVSRQTLLRERYRDLGRFRRP
ncbi:MAG: amidohydrolase family protein [Myxococcales bacterium]|nr:amidohydrolase family protein [Myxococcales bacterium]